jgi:hypothetical protein
LNFDHISATPFPATPRPGEPQPNNSGLTPDLQNALANFVRTNCQQRSAPPATSTSNTTPQIAATFNHRNLPPTVQARYLQHQQQDTALLPGNRMNAFTTNIPKTNDPSTFRKQQYHLDPPGSGDRLITRGGTFFYLAEQDAAKDKQFLTNMPSCKGSSPEDIRAWYQHLIVHANSHGIYIHPYFCFRKEADSPMGFTHGDDDDYTTYDLPKKYAPHIDRWRSKIYTALRGDKVFPKDICTKQRNAINNYYGGRGYEALYAIIRSDHPNNKLYPFDLIKNPPVQSAAEDLDRYFFRYKDYLHIRAFLTNNENNLNDKHELDNFIGGTRNSAAFRRYTREDRKSNDPLILQQFSQGQIISTLNIIQDELRKTAGRAPSPTRPAKTIGRCNLLNQFSPKFQHGKSPSRPKSSVHQLQLEDFNPHDPMTSVDIPDGCEEVYAPFLTGYSAAIMNVNSDPRHFDTAKPCLVCGKPGHTFDGCPVLNNTKFLQRSWILWKSHLARQKRLEAEVDIKQVQVDAINFMDLDEEPEPDPDNTEQNFRPGQE